MIERERLIQYMGYLSVALEEGDQCVKKEMVQRFVEMVKEDLEERGYLVSDVVQEEDEAGGTRLLLRVPGTGYVGIFLMEEAEALKQIGMLN